ncbi:Na/Pi cotransporter family protein [Acidaminobacter sp. JC074]|uniref:Na/Pi cotransporter family protein n=1 Tax=Acidaminobacter sp. JC074 TaxID=2530199 RepID=UPI001F0F30DB|nr:Na/Pi cotransporter family protein [Acidaminobacter sp. JC074]
MKELMSTPGWEMFVLLFSGLGLFLYGMNLMSEGLEKAAGNRLKSIVGALTTNRYVGVAVGAFVTAIVQSSSASTVMVVGFVNAGIMTLTQAIGVIMGANIGTTMTSVLVALKLTDLAPFAIGIGVMLMLFSKNTKTKKYAQILLGFGILFLGMDTMKAGMSDLKKNPVLGEILASFGEPGFFNTAAAIFVGFAMTAIVQSSSATTGILVGLAATGNISLAAAFPILLGTNIGTCVTAMLSSVGANKNARRAAVMHLTFNLIGTVLFIIALRIPTLWFVEEILAGRFGFDTAKQVASAHVIFNLVTTFLLIWFAPILVRFAKLIIPETEDEKEEVEGVKYLDERILETPSIAMAQVSREVLHMGKLSLKEFQYAVDSFIEGDVTKAKKTFKTERIVNELEHDIANYLVKLTNTSISYQEREMIDGLFSTIGDIERVGDHADNLAEMTVYRVENNLSFSESAMEEIKHMSERVIKSYKQSLTAIKEGNHELARSVIEREGEIDLMEKNLRKKHIRRLNEGKCQPAAGVLFLDIINNLERIGDHASNIATAVLDSAVA